MPDYQTENKLICLKQLCLKQKKLNILELEKIRFFFPESLSIKYEGEQEQFLTSGKVDLEDFMEKQKPYYQKVIEERNEKIKGWKERYKNYRKYYETK